MGLFKGAHAKAILAHLPSRRLSRLYLDHQDEIARAGLGERWPEFQKAVAAMRKSPYVLSRRDFGRPYFALGAPIFDSDDKIVASISVTAPDDTYSPHREDQLSTVLLNAAELLNRRVREFTAL
jgi:DNA-binding IclR family transcriptional regulator